MKNMKKVMITIAALAMTFGVSAFAAAQQSTQALERSQARPVEEPEFVDIQLLREVIPAAGVALDLDFTPAPFEHTHRVSGRFKFEYPVKLLINAQASPMWPWKAQATETKQTRNIANAIVVLQDSCGHYIRRETSSSGGFSFEWTPVGCAQAEITVLALSEFNPVGVARWDKGPIASTSELTNKNRDYRLYSFTRTFNIADATGGLNLGTVVVPMSNDAARGFFIMDNMQQARAYYARLPGVTQGKLPKINVEHTKGLKPAEIGCKDGDWGTILSFAFYLPGLDPGYIHIPWDCSDLGFDGHAHVHETSHYFQRHFLRQNPSYGRFGEGLANVQAALIRNTSWITTTGTGLLENLDINARMACWNGSNWAPRIDTVAQHAECLTGGGTPGFPQAVSWDNTLANAGWFQRIIYDMTDGGNGEPEELTRFIPLGQTPATCGATCEFGQFDKVSGGPSAPPSALALNDVLIYYLGGSGARGTNPNYVDRGLNGLDITDVLDGFICRGHAAPQHVSEIMSTAMGLNYDPSGAPKSCPHPED
ncbi:MAG: hypothetical protein OEU68_17765 [Nitrospira sp.]|nr:hypothetical protein [Nitrospira sp.]MDH4243314.1 hypothetical protein [Nitrospira sp.]MDH4356353.1 hypothetical protein [Nitrospira sp.]MDH5320510.1 hypothetical protein [Nitrospira sp.]